VIALLITTQNRTALLAKSLRRLQDRTLPDEIVIVDDGGSDGCDELCWSLRNYPVPIRYVFTANYGDSQCSHARNVGIKSTDADLIVTSEPELLFETDVIAQMLAHRAESEVVSAGTIIHEQENAEPQTTVGWVAPFAALYKREWLLGIGGWDEGPWPDPWGWEDTDLLTRLRENGHGQIIDPEIVCRHLWHGPRWCDQVANEAYFKAKVFPRDILANAGREWGIA
jgi:glycosyltransferase involved in cell wall biosynthesis